MFMNRNRIHSLVVFGFVAMVGLLLVSGVRATTPATDTSAARLSESRIKLRINCEGRVKGPQMNAVGRGRFTLSGAVITRSGGIYRRSGAISDRGTFVERFHGIHPPNDGSDRTLLGAKGTIQFDVDGNGLWRVTRGTGAYAALRGRGTERGLYSREIDITMTGTVSRK